MTLSRMAVHFFIASGSGLKCECEQYSEPIWKLLEIETATNETLNRISQRGQPPGKVEMHAFLVLYGVWAGAPCSHVKEIMALIQENKNKNSICIEDIKKKQPLMTYIATALG